MKKILITLLMLATSAGAADLTFTNPAPKNGSQEVLAQKTAKMLESVGIQSSYVGTGVCTDSVGLYNTTKEPTVIVYTNNWPRISKNKNLPCVPDLSDSKVLLHLSVPLWMCTSTGDRQFKPGQRFASFTSSPVLDLVADFNQQNGTDLKPVPIPTSAEILLGMLNKDIEWSMVLKTTPGVKEAHESGKIACLYTNTAKDSSLPYFYDKYKMSSSTAFKLDFYFFARNLGAKQEKQLRTLLDPQKNPEFAKILDYDGYVYNRSKKTDSEQIKQFFKDSQENLEYYKR